jgi:hypothetical protein
MGYTVVVMPGIVWVYFHVLNQVVVSMPVIILVNFHVFMGRGREKQWQIIRSTKGYGYDGSRMLALSLLSFQPPAPTPPCHLMTIMLSWFLSIYLDCFGDHPYSVSAFLPSFQGFSICLSYVEQLWSYSG